MGSFLARSLYAIVYKKPLQIAKEVVIHILKHVCSGAPVTLVVELWVWGRSAEELFRPRPSNSYKQGETSWYNEYCAQLAIWLANGHLYTIV